MHTSKYQCVCNGEVSVSHFGLKLFREEAAGFGCLTRVVLRFDNEKKKICLK